MLKLWKNGAEGVAKGGVKAAVKDILQQAGLEGMEEVETDIANKFSDAIINKDKSEFNTQVEDYKAQGMDEKEAFGRTLLDNVADTVESFAGGAIGGLVGGGGAIAGSVATTKEAKKLDGNYREVAQAIPDNVEDYNSEEDYNKAMEVKARAEELDTQDKVSNADRSGLLQDIYAVNETLPNTDLIENINESVNSPFADVGGFQVTKNDITSQQVAQSMAQANNVNDFVEAYRDSQASSNVEARQTGQEYFETLAPKFDTYDEGSRPLDLALTQRSAEDLYTAALNGEEVNQEELNTQKKQQLFQRGMLENTVKQKVEVQKQARREEQKTFEPTQLHNIETPQGKADIADITLDNEGNFKWTKGDEEVIVPRKDISDNAMQRFMVNALNQPTLSAKQLYIDNYDGSLPIGSYNNAYESAFNAGQLNSKNFKGWLGSHKFYARSIPESTLKAFFNEGAKQVENKSKKVTSAKTKGTGKVTAEKSVENTPIHKLAQAFASRTGIDVEIRDGSILVTDGAQNALTDAEGNEIYSNGQFQADISKVIVGANGKELQTFMHEAIGEVLEAYNPEDMADIQDAILNYLLESKGDNYVDKTIKRYQRLYQAAEGAKSYRDAANEMVNDTLVGLFTTDKGANDFVNWCTKNDKSVLDKITDFIQAIIDKLKSLISDANLSSEARTVAEMSEKQAQKIRDRLFKAMDKAIDNYKGAEEGKASTSTRNSLDIDDIDDIDEALMSDYERDLLNEWFASDKPTKAEKKEAVKFGKGYDFVESGNKKLAYTEDRIEQLLKDYAASNPDYAQAYVAYINPIDFLKLTTGANQRAMKRIENEGKKLDLAELQEETQPLFLDIDEEEGEVIGHEGRHRMYALYKEGYTSVPILLFNYQNKYSKQNIDSIDLLPQWFSEKDDNISDRITVTNLMPFSRGNEEEIRAQYGKGTSADARFSLDVDSEGNELSLEQQDYFKDSKVVDENGNLLVLYHQTDSDFTVFDTRREGAGTSDRQTPFGIFLKSSDTNIGLAGNKQMKLYANITNPLVVRDRSELSRMLNELIPEYSNLSEEYKRIDRYYSAREKEADRRVTDYMVEWAKKNPNSKRADIYNDEEYNRLFEEQDGIIDDWGEEADAISIKSKEAITQGLQDAGYDGLIIREDSGSFGRRTDAYIALEPNQVKNVDNKKPTDSEDIRYSLVDTEGNELTEGQQEYFKDSKIRDEQGRLKVMYHGTANRFYVYDNDKIGDNYNGWLQLGNGFYFTDDRKVAKGFAKAAAKKNNKSLFSRNVQSVYLNLVNPYIVGETQEDDVYELDKRNALTIDRDKLIKLGYDGIIYTPQISSEPNQYVAFNSNQIKEVTNTNPTESEDIRYSLDVPTTYALDEEYSPFIDDDIAETKESKGAFVEIIKAANSTLNYHISDKRIENIADKVIAQYSSTVDKDFVTKNLRNIFSAMNSDNIQDMTNALINLSEEVVRQSEEIDPDEQANYEDFIKNMPKIKLSEEQKNEAINRMGDWNTVFGAMGRFLSNDTTTTLDGNVYWQICDNALEHNYVMDRDATDADQLMNIIEAVENLRPQSRAIFEGGDITDAALVTANEIMQQYYGYALKDAQANANLKEVRADLKKQVDDYKRVIGKQYQEQVNRLNKQLKDKDSEIKQLRAFNTSEISKAISIEKARVATAEKKARADKTSLNKYIERQERNKHLKSIRNQAIRTIKMLENPTRNKFIPEVLQKPTIEMLQTFDFVTYRVRKNGELVPWGEEKGGEPTKTNQMWREKMEKLQSVLNNLEGIQDEEDLSKYGNNSSYLYNLSVQLGDVTKGLLDQFLQDTQNDTVKISTLNSEKLKVLDDFMKSYLASINGAQEAMIDGNNVQLAQVGQQVASEISGLKSLNAVAGTIKKKVLDFLNLDMAEPITVFSELGGTMEKLYWHLEQGKDVRDGHIFATEDAFSKAKEELNIDKNEPSKWETGLMSFKNGQLQLTPAQVMSLYAAYGRSQARHHIIFGGVMSSDEGLRGKDKKLKKVQTKPVHLTPKDVEEIVSTLTPEQKALADFMVDYMSNEVSDWGNRVSQKRWGIRLFTESHYFPIKTFDVTRPSRTMDENANASLFSLQNQGFTKPLQKDANNALVLEDIFKVFSEHVAKMAAYDGYVIPINDFMRVFNYAESQETFVVKQGEEGQHREDSSVKEQIQRVFGTKGTQYFTKFIKNVNEDFGEGGSINLIDKLFSNNKAQAVLANGRVVIQQPTAYPRAMEVIDGKYLVKALSTSPVGLKKKIQRSKSHNTLAKFKSKGYYETSIGQSMQQMITGTATTKDKVNEVAGALAGLMDDWTWSVIYQAAEYKVQAEQKKLEVNSKEYFDAVNKVANEAFIKTQVVDSVFTKSQMMRSRDTGDKMLTAFMAEPTKYYNMLHRGAFNMYQHGNKKAFAKAVYLFVIGQVLNSVAQSAYDAWRDDDDEKDAMEKFLNALLGISDVQEANGVWATMQAILKANLVENLLPINLLPVVKEVNSALAGWDSKNMSTQAIYDIVGDAKKIVDWAEGKGTLTTYGVLNTVAHSLSLATGMPVSSALREVKDLYNNVNNLWDGTNLVKNEQTKSAKAQITKSDNIQETVKTLYQEKIQENLEKGKTQKEAEKAAKSSVGSAITGAYKNDLVELTKTNMSEATSMKAEAIKGFTALGISQADANKRVEKWFK